MHDDDCEQEYQRHDPGLTTGGVLFVLMVGAALAGLLWMMLGHFGAV